MVQKQKGMRACQNDQHGTTYNSRVSIGREKYTCEAGRRALKETVQNQLEMIKGC